jgi:hypothetical protein
MVLWFLTPCSIVDAEQPFRGRYGQKYFRGNIATTSLYKIEADSFSETLVTSYQTTRHHKQSNGYFAMAFYCAVLLLYPIIVHVHHSLPYQLKQSNGYFAVAFYCAVLLLYPIIVHVHHSLPYQLKLY